MFGDVRRFVKVAQLDARAGTSLHPNGGDVLDHEFSRHRCLHKGQAAGEFYWSLADTSPKLLMLVWPEKPGS
jgi:hypothetical protein